MLESTTLPQAEQNRLASGTSVAQEGQRIGRRLYHCAPGCWSRRLFRSLTHCHRFRQDLAGLALAAIEKSRRAVNPDRQQSHGFNPEDALPIQETRSTCTAVP